VFIVGTIDEEFGSPLIDSLPLLRQMLYFKVVIKHNKVSCVLFGLLVGIALIL